MSTIQSEEQARDYVRALCNVSAFANLGRLVDGLIAENRNQNLIAEPTVEIIWQRHIADSAQLLEHVSRGTSPWLDLGSGPGLPGLVLAVMRPELKFVLIEERQKRTNWLVQMVARLQLPNVSIEASRLQTVPRQDAGVISARAFAPLAKLLKLSARFSTSETAWVLPKGRSAEQEIRALPERLQQVFHVKQSLTSADAGIIVGRGQIRAGELP
ncbi:16S rRNA (guanine(527)-N(7))-methyltransferase RsmG [Qipengyuania sp. JC766]|uniref:16S rRNA (guanine(527)-N(7))-methyltransferase RsmG n=1 Tax=Qipengyuania sp. JC766 TaxID=3232139 RepID=UPI00345A0F89